MSTLAAVPRHEAARSRPPRPRMAWITWRQHRVALAGVAALLAACTLLLGVTGLRMQSAYDALVRGGCQMPAGVAGTHCGLLWGAYYHGGYPLTGNLSLLTVALAIIPVIIGMFTGAPLLAREYEARTVRFAWTQAAGRTRWVAAKLVLLGVALTVAAAAFGALASWWLLLADRAAGSGRWQPEQFGLTAITFAGWTLLMFTGGVFAGAAIRRTVPAMAATAGCGTALLWFTVEKFTPLLTSLSPLSAPAGLIPEVIPASANSGTLLLAGSAMTGPAGSLAVNMWFTGPHGRIISADSIPAFWNLQVAARPGWLASHHLTLWISYQSAGRFWLFQTIEGAIGLLLALALGVATVRLVRRQEA